MIIDFKTKREALADPAKLLVNTEESEFLKQMQESLHKYEEEKEERLKYHGKNIFISCKKAGLDKWGNYSVSGIYGLVTEVYCDAYQEGYRAALMEAIKTVLGPDEIDEIMNHGEPEE